MKTFITHISIFLIVGVTYSSCKKYQIFNEQEVYTEVTRATANLFEQRKYPKELRYQCTKDKIFAKKYYLCKTVSNNVLETHFMFDTSKCNYSIDYSKFVLFKITTLRMEIPHTREIDPKRPFEKINLLAFSTELWENDKFLVNKLYIGELTNHKNDEVRLLSEYDASLKTSKKVNLILKVNGIYENSDHVLVERIVDEKLNKIGGSKPLVFNLKDFFNGGGLVLDAIELDDEVKQSSY